MLSILLAIKERLLVLGAVGVLIALQGSVSAEKAACGTCWHENPATCIIDGVKVEDACDSTTPMCIKPS